jgi:CheY-like chemotaxis protein
MLKAMGHDSTACHDGPSAIEIAEKLRPTLILLDIGLPGMNGYEVAKRLRTIPALMGVMIAALTGYGEEQDRRRSDEVGFDRYFVKPISFPALQELIQSLPKAVV